MSKPRFSIGEFVYAVNHESSTLFYIYDYRAGKAYPYNIISIKRRRVYTARARELRAIINIINLITIILNDSSNFTKTIKRLRSTRLKNRYMLPSGYPLSWTLDLRNKEIRHVDI